MEKMKKLLMLMLAVVMCLAVVVGCGGEGNTEITGETYDTGIISVLVPKNWEAYPVMDYFTDSNGVVDPNQVRIVKDAKSELDTFSKPYLQITYYETQTSEPMREFYTDPQDIEPITTDKYTWNGFTALSLEYPVAVLWTQIGDSQIQILMMLESSDGKVAIEDADVQAIIASVSINE